MQVPRLRYCAVGCVRHCHREMWNAGELDLNALLAADSRRPMPATTTETLPLTASSPDVIKHFTPNNIAHDVITDGESTANIP